MMDKTEVKRQAFHALVGLLVVVLISFGILEEVGTLSPLDGIYFLGPLSRVLFLTLIFGGILIFLSLSFRIPGIEWILNNFERSDVQYNFPGKGAFFFCLGAFILSLFLDMTGVAASMLIVSVGDSVSHLVGKEYGEVKHPLSKTKYAEGHVAGGFLGGLGASFFIAPPIAFTASFVSIFFEGVEFGGELDRILDDNLFVPLISGIVITLLEPIFI